MRTENTSANRNQSKEVNHRESKPVFPCNAPCPSQSWFCSPCPNPREGRNNAKEVQLNFRAIGTFTKYIGDEC